MRNLVEHLSARHVVVLSLALMLVLGGVSAAFANRDAEQARREESLAAEAVAAEDEDDDDTNGDTLLERMTASASPSASPTGVAAANWTDNDGTDSDGHDTTGVAAANWTDNDGTDSDGVDTGAAADDDSASGDDSDSN
jgi:hypothetical protein